MWLQMTNTEEAFSHKLQKANEVLDELESYLNSANYALFSNTQVTVDRIRMEEYVQQLRQYLNAGCEATAFMKYHKADPLAGDSL